MWRAASRGWCDLLQYRYWLGFSATVPTTPPQPVAAAAPPCPRRGVLLPSFATTETSLSFCREIRKPQPDAYFSPWRVAQGAARDSGSTRNPGSTRKTRRQPWKGDGKAVGSRFSAGFPPPLRGLGRFFWIPRVPLRGCRRSAPPWANIHRPSGTGTRTRRVFSSFATEAIWHREEA